MKKRIILVLIVAIFLILLFIAIPFILNDNNSEENNGQNNQQNQVVDTPQTQNSFVGTVLEETSTYMIVEPNEDEEERKSADKIKIDYGTEHKDYSYGVGRKVIIKYSGYIKETYPAQIDVDDILINGYGYIIRIIKADNKLKLSVLYYIIITENNNTVKGIKYEQYY